MNPDDDRPLIPDSGPQFQPPSPETLTLQIPTVGKPQSFLDPDGDDDPLLLTPKSPPATPHDAGATRRGIRGRKPGPKSRRYTKSKQLKIDALLDTFKPIPFAPAKTLDFSGHEDLLKRLGLWDFVHVNFDANLRSDLIAQLIATFRKKERCSYVNEARIQVSRADLMRALKLPQKKKEKASEILFDVPEDKECVFLLEFVSNWVLLHDDSWKKPDNVVNWINAIENGRFESLDWPEMMWFMVEKELLQGQALGNCYYASHLQCMIRYQKEELLKEEVDLKEKDEDAKMVDLEEHSLELSLGNDAGDGADIDEKEVAADAEVGVMKGDSFGYEKMDAEDESRGGLEDNRVEVEDEGNDGADLQGKEEDEVEEQGGVGDALESEDKGEHGGQWFLDGQNEPGGSFLRQCSFSNADICLNYDIDKGTEGEEGEEGEHEVEEEAEEVEDDDDDDYEDEEGEEDEQRDGQGGFPMSDDINGMEGLSSANLIQPMDNDRMPFSSGVQVHDNSCGKFLASSSRAETHLVPGDTSIFGNPKREMDHDDELMLDNGSNKRMRTEPLDFNYCRENVMQWLEKMRMAHEAKEQMFASSAMNQQMLLNELQQRNDMIDHLQKLRHEDMQKMQLENYKLERELHMMTGLIQGYRKALKESKRAFAEYRDRCPQLDEPLYKDVPGSGGHVLGVAELEKLRVRREVEERMKLSIMKEHLKEVEAVWSLRFEAYHEKVELCNTRLLKIEEGATALKESVKKRKVFQEMAKDYATQEEADESAAPEKAEDSAAPEKAADSAAPEKAEDFVGSEKARDPAVQEMVENSNVEENVVVSAAVGDAGDSDVQEKDEEAAKAEESMDEEMTEAPAQVEI